MKVSRNLNLKTFLTCIILPRFSAVSIFATKVNISHARDPFPDYLGVSEARSTVKKNNNNNNNHRGGDFVPVPGTVEGYVCFRCRAYYYTVRRLPVFGAVTVYVNKLRGRTILNSFFDILRFAVDCGIGLY
jgi:hypothetical protein